MQLENIGKIPMGTSMELEKIGTFYNYIYWSTTFYNFYVNKTVMYLCEENGTFSWSHNYYTFPTGSVYGFDKKRRKRTPTISESASSIKILHIVNKARSISNIVWND